MNEFALVWESAAVAGLIRTRKADPQTAKAIRAAVNALIAEPRPTESVRLGDTDLRRLRVGDARLIYEVDDAHRSVRVLTVGLIGRKQ